MMKTPSAVINWTGSSNREIKKRNSSEKRSNKGRSGRISDEELKNMTDELDEIERRERLAWKPGPRYRRTAESFLTTEYRRKLAADIEKYARQVKEGSQDPNNPGLMAQCSMASKALKDNASLSHLTPESIELGLAFNRLREAQVLLNEDLAGDGDCLVSLQLSHQILSADLIGAEPYKIYSYNKA